MNRIILVTYNCICGEYEFSGHCVLNLLPRQRADAQIHKYFMGFYSEGNLEDADRLNNYSYNMGEVGVSDISWKEITPEQQETLRTVGLAY